MGNPGWDHYEPTLQAENRDLRRQLAEAKETLETAITNCGFDVHSGSLRDRIQVFGQKSEATVGQRDDFRDELDSLAALQARYERLLDAAWHCVNVLGLEHSIERLRAALDEEKK
jgi:hypothetical protein